MRQSKYLNNLGEQDHRAVKRIARPMLGFKTSRCARILIAGIDVMHMARKDQIVDIKDRSSSEANQFYSWFCDRCRACSNAWPLAAIATEPLTPVERPVRRVLRLIEHTINAPGQVLIVPEYELDGWTTSLPAGQFSGADIIALYADTARTSSFTPSSRPTWT